MKRQPHHTPWGTGLHAIAMSQPHTPETVAKLMIETRGALIRLLEGTGSMRDLARIGTDINVAYVRAEQIGNTPEVESILRDAGEAINEAQGICERHGRPGLTGLGRQAIAAGVDAFETILAASSPRQMHNAEEELSRFMRRAERRAA